MNDFRKTLNDCLQEFEFNQIEIGPLKTPLTISFYQDWLEQNYFGSMNYLKEHLELKRNPQGLNENLKSVISIAQAYYPAVAPPPEKNPARVALYSQNNDYHHWLKVKLQQVIEKLKALYPDEIFLPYVDSGPVLERNWAYENQLGWFGKNTCLIHPQFGSLFFIAEILTSKATQTELKLQPLPDFCGKCQKCIEICPTQALIEPRKMKADLCISYLTIESKEVPPLELRAKMQDWFFGCDLCQTVCPWNEKFFRQKEIESSNDLSIDRQLNLDPDEKKNLIEYFRWLLAASHNQIQKKNLGSALARAGAKGLKRNALIVIANRGLIELKDDVQNLELTELEELKNWTLQQLLQKQC